MCFAGWSTQRTAYSISQALVTVREIVLVQGCIVLQFGPRVLARLRFQNIHRAAPNMDSIIPQPLPPVSQVSCTGNLKSIQGIARIPVFWKGVRKTLPL